MTVQALSPADAAAGMSWCICCTLISTYRSTDASQRRLTFLAPVRSLPSTMLRLHMLAASQQQQLHGCNLQQLCELQQLLPAAVAAALPQVQQQHHQVFSSSSFEQLRSASTNAAEATSSSKPAFKYPSKHEQRVAHLKFCQARAAWRREVKQLRMQWLADHKQQQAQQRQATEEVKQEIARLQQLRSADKQHDREKHQLERMLWDAERTVDNAERRLQSARREEMRQETLSKYRRIWRKKLEVDSRTWIAPEDLTARIAAALDNPLHL